MNIVLVLVVAISAIFLLLYFFVGRAEALTLAAEPRAFWSSRIEKYGALDSDALFAYLESPKVVGTKLHIRSSSNDVVAVAKVLGRRMEISFTDPDLGAISITNIDRPSLVKTAAHSPICELARTGRWRLSPRCYRVDDHAVYSKVNLSHLVTEQIQLFRDDRLIGHLLPMANRNGRILALLLKETLPLPLKVVILCCEASRSFARA